MKQKKSYVITYADAEDASCADDQITAGIFGRVLENQKELIAQLEKQGFRVVRVPFDRADYQAYLAKKNLPDTRANRATWSAAKGEMQ